MVENPTLVAILAVLVACGALAALAIVLSRARHPARREEDEMAALARQQTDAAARLEGMIKLLANGQSQLQRAVNDRLDSVSSRLGNSMEKTKQNTAENLQKLNERLAVIDRAQKNITELATQVTSLQSVLANKQSRGAFGQGQMEAIIQDSLPKGAYAFQQSLSNRTRPDCCVFLPDRRPLVIDAKFPLEAVTAYREAKSEDERKAAAQRLRTDVAKHVGDIAGKYLIPGETQELAFMFVPSESVYAELHDGFDDIVQKAFRAKVVIVSPSLLMIAIHVIRQIQKDARMREAAGADPRRSRTSDEGRQLARRARPQAANPFQSIERGHPAGDHLDRQDRGARRAHSRSRARRSGARPEHDRRAGAQAGGRRVSWSLPPALPRRLSDTLAVYLKRRVLVVTFLGFSSGLPLALSGSTLLVWMREVGVDLGTIGLFALVGTPYTVKFLWAPLVDALDVPVLSRRFGRRRGWLLLAQFLLIAAIVLLGACDPAASALVVALGALLVAAASATQDIVVDAFRVESLDESEQAAGMASYVAAYRIGMLASTAGALFLVSGFEPSSASAATPPGAPAMP